jgi:hypothetical protein
MTWDETFRFAAAMLTSIGGGRHDRVCLIFLAWQSVG